MLSLMAELTITVRDGADADLLAEIAANQWRHVEQQASAFVEQALSAARARANPDNKRGPRRVVATNGVSNPRVATHS